MDPDSVKCQVQKRPTRPTCEHMNYSGPTEVPYVCIYIYIHTGWWFQHPRKILVSWGCYSQYMEKQKLFQTTNQYIYIYTWKLFRQPRHIMDSWVLNLHVSHAFFIHHFIFTSFFNFLTLCRVIQTLPPFLSMMSQFKNEKKPLTIFPRSTTFSQMFPRNFHVFLTINWGFHKFPQHLPPGSPLHTTRRCPARKAASSWCSTAQSTTQKAPRPSACCSDGLAARRALVRPGGGGQRSKTCHFSVFSD